MAFNVQDFRSSLRYDGARPNLFEVTISTAGLGIGNIGNDMVFKCRTAQLPEDNIGVIPVNYFGREIKVAGNRTFPEWTVTVLNDEDFKIRNALELWMSGLNSHVSNLRDPAYRENRQYTTDAYVTQYGKSGNKIAQYKMVGCFPINLTPIDLDWASNDTIEEFSITWAFQWWENYRTTDSTGSVASSYPG